MDLKINTTSCQMQWGDSHRYNGSHLDRQFQVPGKPSYFTLSYKICKIAFTSTIYIGSQVRVNISGEHAFSMESTHGNIEIKTPIDISGSSKFIFVARTSIGGFVKRSADEVEAGREWHIFLTFRKLFFLHTLKLLHKTCRVALPLPK